MRLRSPIGRASSTGLGLLARLLAALAFLDGSPASLAHDGPEHEIEELTEAITLRGASADLLVDRALEWRLLGRNADALQDLEAALRLDPHHVPALREFARLQAAGGESRLAQVSLNRALALRDLTAVDRGELLIQRAELMQRLGQPRPALADCEAALRLHRSHPEWYLLRSDLQRSLRLHRRRLAGLEQGIRETGAGVLSHEHLDALLDARRFREALPRIESELAESRFKGHWLVRRGRALLGLRQTEAGRADLMSALAEFEALRQVPNPDPSLLRDQAMAQRLLKELGTRSRRVL